MPIVRCSVLAASACVALLLCSTSVSGAQTQPTVFVEKGHAGGWARDAAFSPDYKYVLSAGLDGQLILWDFATGREIRRKQCSCRTPAFSIDGYVAVVATDYGAELLSLPSLVTRSVIGGLPDLGTVQALAISPKDGSLLTFYDGKQGRVLILWRIDTRTEIRRSIVGPAESGRPGFFLINFRLMFSQHGDYIMLREDLIVSQLMGVYGTATLQRVDIAHSPFASYSGSERFVGISNDGRFGVETIESRTGPTVQFVRDMQTGARHNLAIECYPIFASFSADSQLVLAGCDDSAIDLYDTATGRRHRSFGGHPVLGRLENSRDGTRLLTGMHWWDLNTLTLAGSLPPQSFYRMSPDGKYATACPETSFGKSVQPCRLWNLDENKEVTDIDIPLGANGFTPDSKSLLATKEDGTLVWSIQERKVIHTYPAISTPWLAVSPDQKYIVGIDKEDILHEWSFESGLPVLQLPLAKSGGVFSEIAFAPDSETVLIRNKWLFDVKTGKLRFELTDHILESAFSPDGNTILTWASGNFFELFNAHTGQLQHRIPTPRQAFGLAFLRDNRHFVSREADEMLHLWDADTGVDLLSFVSFADTEWIALTPQGYYKASAKGDQHLSLHVGDQVYGIDQWRHTFDRPRIVEAAFRVRGSPDAPASVVSSSAPGLAAEWQAQPPSIEIRSPADGNAVSSGTAEISFTVDDSHRAIESISMLVNGRQLSGAGDSDPQNPPASSRKGLAIPSGQRHLDLKIPVRLGPGKNHIEVTAFNGISEAKKSLQLDYFASTPSDALLPNLWILAIGVNSYQSTEFPALSYAEADARAVADAFGKQKGKVFREVHTLLITDNSPVKPTAENIVDNLNYLRQAGQNDVVLLFVAGHGIIDSSGDFYFLPQDAALGADGALRRSRAVSWHDLKSVLDVPSRKIILLDACHSEGVTGRKTRGVEGDALVRELHDTRGVIISSSRGKELSQESPEWHHGAFTYALLEGLSGKADFRHTQRISMLALATYVSEQVPQMTGGAQHPIIDTPDGYEELEIARLP